MNPTKPSPTIAPDRSGLTPQQIVQTYSAEEWEAFIEEWTDGFDPPYEQVVRISGPGDKGRDVVAHVTDPTAAGAEWDNFQCKHYNHALRPTDIYIELAKLVVFTRDGSFTKPRRYRFVAPFGVGTKLYDLLRNPNRLKSELIENWDAYCRNEISEKTDVPLVSDLKQYVLDFDFSIVWFVTPSEILEQHRRTRHWHRRFKIDPPIRPTPEPVPKQVQTHELRYVSSLLDAYADHLNKSIECVDDLAGHPKLARHFMRSREYFFSAEALGRFSRDNFERTTFDAVKRQIYDGVIETAESHHADGLACLQKVLEVAVGVNLPASELQPYLEPSDRKGLCHHLANDGELTWCSDDRSNS